MLDEKSLESVLKTKYGLQERLYVEGRCVPLFGNSKDPLKLVTLGIGEKSFVVATVNLAGKEIDYDVISVTPLSLLSLTCQSSNRLRVQRKFRHEAQVYQLCSNSRLAEVWDSFVTHVRAINTQPTTNAWQEVTLVATANEETAFNHVTKQSLSVDLLLADIKFDSFVNDAPADDLALLDNKAPNISNNSLVNEDVGTEGTQKSDGWQKVGRFFANIMF